MGWHMKLVICVQLAYVSVCLTREMSVVNQWTSLEVQLSPKYEPASSRSIRPSDVKSWFIYKDRVFVALREQPYSLAYFNLTDKSTSPLLQPYPNYKDGQKIYKPYQVHVDRCDRLWVLSENNQHTKDMNVFDVKAKSILRTSTIPSLADSLNMTVDDFDCDNEYVYISDDEAVWTYSWAAENSTRHKIDRIGSMVLTPNSTVNYNVAGESTVYYMPTTHLKDMSNKTIDIRKLGRSRNLNVNLISPALDAKNDVLYYFNNDNKTVIHAVPCWTSERCSLNCQDVSIDPTHELKYITVDENGYLRAIASRSSFKVGEINFRLLSEPVNSICVESKVNDTTNKPTPGVRPTAKSIPNTSTAAGVDSTTKSITNTTTGEYSNAKETNTTNINESTTAPSSATDGRTICKILPLLIFLITILTKV